MRSTKGFHALENTASVASAEKNLTEKKREIIHVVMIGLILYPAQ